MFFKQFLNTKTKGRYGSPKFPTGKILENVFGFRITPSEEMFVPTWIKRMNAQYTRNQNI